MRPLICSIFVASFLAFSSRTLVAQPLVEFHESVEALIAPAAFAALGTIKSVKKLENSRFRIETRFLEVVKRVGRAVKENEFGVLTTIDDNWAQHKGLESLAKKQTKGLWVFYAKWKGEKFRRWKFFPFEGNGVDHFGYMIGSIQPPKFSRDLKVLSSEKEILDRIRHYGPISQMIHDPNRLSVATIRIPASILGPIKGGGFNQLSIPIDSKMPDTARRLLESPDQFAPSDVTLDRHAYDTLYLAGIDLLGSQKNEANIKALVGCLSKKVQPLKHSLSPLTIRTKACEKLLGWRFRPPTPDFAHEVESIFLGSSGIDDDSLVHLTKFENLEEVTLWDTRISHVGINHLKGLKKLKTIALDDMVISDAMVRTLKQNKQLHLMTQAKAMGHLRPSSPDEVAFLKFWCAPFTDHSIQHFTEFKNLKFIDLGRMEITDKAIRHLQSFQHLKFAELHETKITKDGAKQLKKALPGCSVSLK